MAACFLLMAAILDYVTGKGWPPIEKLRYAAPPIWGLSQLMVLAILYQLASSQKLVVGLTMARGGH